MNILKSTAVQAEIRGICITRRPIEHNLHTSAESRDNWGPLIPG